MYSGSNMLDRRIVDSHAFYFLINLQNEIESGRMHNYDLETFDSHIIRIEYEVKSPQKVYYCCNGVNRFVQWPPIAIGNGFELCQMARTTSIV